MPEGEEEDDDTEAPPSQVFPEKRAMSNWTDVNRLRLIEAFRKRPCLWCTANPDFSQADRRKDALTEITNYLNQFESEPECFSEEDVRTQLKNLKDMYRRKVKRMKQMLSVAQSVEEPSWIYFRHLKFLEGMPKKDTSPPHSPSPLEVVKCEPVSSVDEAIATEPVVAPPPPPSITTRRRPPPPPTTVVVKKPRIVLPVRPALKDDRTPSPPVPTRRSNDDVEDELGIFGKFVGHTLRKLASTSPALAIQVKRQINDLLCEAELDELSLRQSPGNVSST